MKFIKSPDVHTELQQHQQFPDEKIEYALIQLEEPKQIGDSKLD